MMARKNGVNAKEPAGERERQLLTQSELDSRNDVA